jgi:hypothetical protein
MNIFRVVTITLCLGGVVSCSSAKRDFINQCANSESDKPICSCAWGKLSQRYSDNELHSIFSGGKAPPQFGQDYQNAEQQCEPSTVGMN